jgi:hypothetical protein
LLRFLHRLNQSSDADDLRSPKAHLGTSAKWIQKYVDGGLDGLVEPIKHKVTSSLNDEQRQELRKMIWNERPTKYGIDREIWTDHIRSYQAIVEYRTKDIWWEGSILVDGNWLLIYQYLQ